MWTRWRSGRCHFPRTMQAFLGNWHAASMASSDERLSQPLNVQCSMTVTKKTKTKYQSRNQIICGQAAQSASSVISSLMASATHKPYRVKLNHMICSRCARIYVNRSLMADESALIYIWVLCICPVWLHDYPLLIVVSDHTGRLKQHCGGSLPPCVTVHLTGFQKMRVQLQCTSCHSLTAEMRLEALKTHGTRLWSTTSKQATRQLLLCYRRKPNQSAVRCSLRLNCTTMFQILVRSAVYAQTTDSTQESRKMHANASALSTSGFCRERKKNKHVNKPEWCITLRSTIDHHTSCGVIYISNIYWIQDGRCLWFTTSLRHEWHPIMIIKHGHKSGWHPASTFTTWFHVPPL